MSSCPRCNQEFYSQNQGRQISALTKEVKELTKQNRIFRENGVLLTKDIYRLQALSDKLAGALKDSLVGRQNPAWFKQTIELLGQWEAHNFPEENKRMGCNHPGPICEA